MSFAFDPWAPYEPTADDPWDLRKVAHLHRRAGFGATWAELQRDLKAGPAASVERLLRPRARTSQEQRVQDSLRQGVLSHGDRERLKVWWLYRILHDPDPLCEKLTLCWHSHFATSNRKVEDIAAMLVQNETLRRHALGDFTALASAIAADPAMLVWLDRAGSLKAKPNENFAREFLELFTLGPGHYTEADIRAAARSFTGWVQKGPAIKYEAAQHDDGDKTFLQQTGRWAAADIVRITLEQPAAAEFLCHKLYRWFVSEGEPAKPELIDPLARALRALHYAIAHVAGIILRSRHFYDQAAYRQRIKGPVEFSAGLIRVLEVPPADLNPLALAVTCERQGQDLFYPPNVKGWDGGKTWLNSTTVIERGNWCNDVIWGNADLSLHAYDPVAWARRHEITPEQAAARLIDLLLDGEPAPTAREQILRAGSDGRPNSLRKALQLIVHCPEYQLA